MANHHAPTDEAEVHQPDVPDHVEMAEFTPRAVITGTLLGVLFGASSIYLVLKVGLTASASIPSAVLAIAIFRSLSLLLPVKRLTILENNIVQTAGSAGESIAFGVGVTMPAAMMLGYQMTWDRVMLVSVLGSTLGILMMIPLRRTFIVKMHKQLKYPEGTACAAVLRSAEKGGSGGLIVFLGLLFAFIHKFAVTAMKFAAEGISVPVKLSSTSMIRNAAVNCAYAVEMLGIGYVLGYRTSAIMVAGSVLGYLVLIPSISYFGFPATIPVAPSDERLISAMDAGEIRKFYLLYIGAGAVATAGIISMLRTVPVILRSLFAGTGGGDDSTMSSDGTQRRTERDLPMSFVAAGCVILLGVLAAFLSRDVPLNYAILGALLVLVFGFVFVMVSSRITGEIGSSSNPISGMTIATLLMTCLIFVGLKMTSSADQILALCIGAVVCVAASNGGTTSQDLKTGYLVGATPKLQQYAILIGATVSALLIGFVLISFNMSKGGEIVTTKAENIPKFNVKDRLDKLTETREHEGKTYKVFVPSSTAESDAKIPLGLYLIDEAGDPKVRIDPPILGSLTKRDDGSEVSPNQKFAAPKTQVIGIVIRGVLTGKLNWDLIALGAMIAVTLELCGVSSLAFAVGVYVGLDDMVPIFIGGCVRYFADSWSAWKQKRRDGYLSKTSELDSDSSPGVLLASGFIAGGSIAGVVANSLNLDFDRMLGVGGINATLARVNLEKYFEEHLYKPMANLVNVSGDMVPVKEFLLSPAGFGLLTFGMLVVGLLLVGAKTPPKADSPPVS